MENRPIQWHPAFCSAMRLELWGDTGKLDFFNEYNLYSCGPFFRNRAIKNFGNSLRAKPDNLFLNYEKARIYKYFCIVGGGFNIRLRTSGGDGRRFVRTVEISLKKVVRRNAQFADKRSKR